MEWWSLSRSWQINHPTACQPERYTSASKAVKVFTEATLWLLRTTTGAHLWTRCSLPAVPQQSVCGLLTPHRTPADALHSLQTEPVLVPCHCGLYWFAWCSVRFFFLLYVKLCCGSHTVKDLIKQYWDIECTCARVRACVSVCTRVRERVRARACVCVCHNEKKVPDEWQARQATPEIFQVSSSKHNAKKITTRERGLFHQSITAILTEEKREEKQSTKPTHVAVYLFRDLDL